MFLASGTSRPVYKWQEPKVCLLLQSCSRESGSTDGVCSINRVVFWYASANRTRSDANQQILSTQLAIKLVQARPQPKCDVHQTAPNFPVCLTRCYASVLCKKQFDLVTLKTKQRCQMLSGLYVESLTFTKSRETSQYALHCFYVCVCCKWFGFPATEAYPTLVRDLMMLRKTATSDPEVRANKRGRASAFGCNAMQGAHTGKIGTEVVTRCDSSR